MSYLHADEVDGSARAAEIIVPLLRHMLRPISSVVDLGGGTGAWLREFARCPSTAIQLYDHESAGSGLLIPADHFSAMDLSRAMPSTQRHFDLAVCVECAEHLPRGMAEPLVEWLTTCSDTVVFSAAIFGQGGKRHINEQFPRYWRELFEKHGFARRDVLRRLILTNEQIPWWYRQNLLLYTRRGHDPFASDTAPDFLPADFELIYQHVQRRYEVPGFRSIFRSTLRRLGTELRLRKVQ